jgi:anti-sigma factor RsiW
MTCDNVRDKLDAYVLDELRFSERVLIGVHVARCRSCSDELADLKLIAQFAPGAIAHPVPRDSYVRLRIRVARQDRLFPDRSAFYLRRMYAFANRAVAATAVLLLTGLSAPFAKQVRIPAMQLGDESRTDRGALNAIATYNKAIKDSYLPEFAQADEPSQSEIDTRERA